MLLEDWKRSEKDRRCTSYTPCVLLSFSPEDREHGLDKARAAAVPPGLNSSRTCSDVSSFAPADHQRWGHQRPHCCAATHLGANLARATSKPLHRASPCSTAQSICIRRLLLLCHFLYNRDDILQKRHLILSILHDSTQLCLLWAKITMTAVSCG